MYYQFPPSSSFSHLLRKISETKSSYVFLMFTFAGCYSSTISKQRYMQSRLHDDIPLLMIDVRQSPAIYHKLQQSFPDIFRKTKLPVHLCCEIAVDEWNKKLTMHPKLFNYTTLADRHFEEMSVLIKRTSLASESKTPISEEVFP